MTTSILLIVHVVVCYILFRRINHQFYMIEKELEMARKAIFLLPELIDKLLLKMEQFNKENNQ